MEERCVIAITDMAEKQGAGDPDGAIEVSQRGVASDFRNAILLRELLGVGLACLILSRGLPPVFRLQDWLPVGFLVSSFPLRALGPVAFRWRAFDMILITLDTAVISLLIFYTGGGRRRFREDCPGFLFLGRFSRNFDLLRPIHPGGTSTRERCRMAVFDMAQKAIILKIVYYGCALGGTTASSRRRQGPGRPVLGIRRPVRLWV